MGSSLASAVRPRNPHRLVCRIVGLCFVTQAHANYTYRPLDVPGADGTVPLGINDSGVVAGFYFDADGGTHGFTRSGGVFTTIDVPTSQAGTTSVLGISSTGALSGNYTDPSGASVGFVDVGGVFTTVRVPGATYVEVDGTNAAGTSVGNYDDASGGNYGFIDVGGVITTFVVPLGPPGQTSMSSITDSGEIVGTYFDAANKPHGFIDIGGVFTTIDEPLAALGRTFVLGVSNDGSLVGTYNDAARYTHGFAMIGGVFQDIDDPMATAANPIGQAFTFAYAINDAHTVVGLTGYGDLLHGFVATVPEPTTALLLLAGVPLLVRRRSKAAHPTRS